MPSMIIRHKDDHREEYDTSATEVTVERIDGKTLEMEFTIQDDVASVFRTTGHFSVAEYGSMLRLEYNEGYILCESVWMEYGEDFSCETSGDKTIYTPISDEELEALLADKEAVQ